MYFNPIQRLKVFISSFALIIALSIFYNLVLFFLSIAQSSASKPWQPISTPTANQQPSPTPQLLLTRRIGTWCLC